VRPDLRSYLHCIGWTRLATDCEGQPRWLSQRRRPSVTHVPVQGVTCQPDQVAISSPLSFVQHSRGVDTSGLCTGRQALRPAGERAKERKKF
jgi:hypothetical protein